MFSRNLSTLALGGLFLTSCLAATPMATPVIEHPPLGLIAATIQFLELKNVLEWTSTENGGRAAVIHSGLVSYAHEQLIHAHNRTKTTNTTTTAVAEKLGGAYNATNTNTTAAEKLGGAYNTTNTNITTAEKLGGAYNTTNTNITTAEKLGGAYNTTNTNTTTPAAAERLVPRWLPRAAVGKFTNIGNIEGYAASYACEKTGAFGISSAIEAYAPAACDSLVSQVREPFVTPLAWHVWQSPLSLGAEGEQVTTAFRYFSTSTQAPQLTASICHTVFSELTHVFCQGKGSLNAATRGGEIRIGSREDYLMIGFDPNSRLWEGVNN